eukprot:PhM_4_TR3024/c0_g1_i1/m.46522/K18442/ARFGEF, BIG; brefeldin A-inhibited guanine nucleotide-exchange protein
MSLSPSFPSDSPEGILLKATRTILGACPKKAFSLRDACNTVLSILSSGSSGDNTAKKLNLFFVPLRMACEATQEALVDAGLDALHALVSFGHITEGMPYEPPTIPVGPRPKSVFTFLEKEKSTTAESIAAKRGLVLSAAPTTLVEAVLNAMCFNSLCASESVQLLCLRGFAALVDSPAAGVHGPILLHVINAVFNVLLQTRFSTVQCTANATLTQILSSVFERVESTPGAASSQGGTLTTSASTSSLQEASPCNVARGSADRRSSTTGGVVKTSSRPRGTSVMLRRTPPSATAPTTTDVAYRIASDVVEEILHNVLPQQNMDDDDDDEDDESAATTTTTNTDQPTEQQPHRHIVPAYVTDDKGHNLPPEFSSVEHYDCIVTFRALCKLSTVGVCTGVDNAAEESAYRTRSRVLSLNMIIHILSESGPALKAFTPFVDSVRTYVCECLLENTTSATYDMFRASCFIFHALILYFRSAMKHEIAIFFTNVFLPILESPNAPFQQKCVVIDVMHRVCGNPQIILDMFVNYDCDVNATNIFELMVFDIARVVQTSHVVPGWVTQMQEITMKVRGLQALVLILRSMVKWASAFAAQPSSSAAADHPRPLTPAATTPSVSPKHGDEMEVVVDGESNNNNNNNNSNGDRDNGADADEEADDEDDFCKDFRFKKESAKLFAYFKDRPKKALVEMQKARLVGETSEEVAFFLAHTQNLCKTAVGTLLSSSDEKTQTLLACYVECFEFAGMYIDEAIRLFMSKFKMVGEAQVVDRTMLHFAQKFYRDNKQSHPEHCPYANADTVYVLAFSIIMLNTDAHNPAIVVKDKMTKAQFVSTNRGIDDGRDIAQSLLEDIYDRITANEIKLENHQYVEENPNINT